MLVLSILIKQANVSAINVLAIKFIQHIRYKHKIPDKNNTSSLCQEKNNTSSIL